MTDQDRARVILHRAAVDVDVPPRPPEEILTAARRSRTTRRAVLAAVAAAAVASLSAGGAALPGGGADSNGSPDPAAPTTASSAPRPTASASARQVLMPNLVGLPSAEAAGRLGQIEASSNWGRPVTVRCEVRPDTVVAQQPAAGTPLEPGVEVQIRTALWIWKRSVGPANPQTATLAR